MSKRQRNPKLFLGALVASSVIALSYKIYEHYSQPSNEKKYTNKSIALTLSHSILNSKLPLNEILINSDNVTFILPPNLSIDDLTSIIIETNDKPEIFELPKTLLNNYKLLNCNNFQGYFSIIKNLKPDMLLVCGDDLGITTQLPKDLSRFVKEIINIDQNDDIVSKVSPIFIR